MNERNYLFNPFNIKNISEIELQKMYQVVFEGLCVEPNSMWEISHNIEVYSNLNYIIGEIIARLTKDIIELKTKIQIETAINCTEERKNWNTEENGKHPAISYFEALATRMSKDDISKLADKECSKSRFRNAYESTENKINSLKKKLDAIKFEEFNQQ